MTSSEIDPRLPLLQHADLINKIVLVRVDHNVVKKGVIQDPYRIDATLGTLYNILERGGRPILMTHVGRPKDKKTGQIKTSSSSSVAPVVEYLERKLHTRFVIPELTIDPERGIRAIDTSINALLKDLRDRKISGIYLPNTRWFEGEEDKGEYRGRFALQLAGLAEAYVNDAFGSWQPHASTFDVARLLPGFAGLLMQKELIHLKSVLEPQRPFVAVVAGSKYDTKIGPLNAIYEKVDHLILGGVMYNTYLCAKYGIRVAGVEDSDIKLAQELVKKDEQQGKIVEPSVLVESKQLESRDDSQCRHVNIDDFQPGREYAYFLDVAPEGFEHSAAIDVLRSASTIFVNAVMGFTPNFHEGSTALYRAIDGNHEAMKMLGGGDTLQELRNLTPGVYMAALDNPNYYFFTGGGTVLKAIEEGTPYGLDPVKALMEGTGNKAA